jgi:hypothetical protein
MVLGVAWQQMPVPSGYQGNCRRIPPIVLQQATPAARETLSGCHPSRPHPELPIVADWHPDDLRLLSNPAREAHR